MLMSLSQHSACSTSSSSSRCPHAYVVSVRALLNSRPTIQAAAAATASSSKNCNKSAVSSNSWPANSPGRLGARAAGVICRDAPRPMWARKSPPPEAPKQIGSGLERLITSKIKLAATVTDLEDVYNEWGSSFNYIHASAALIQCCRLRGGARSPLSGKLSAAWLTQLPDADAQGCANVLWACAKLGKESHQHLRQVWEPTWAAFLRHAQQSLDAKAPPAPQNIPNALWAASVLRKQPCAAELQLLLQVFLRPDVLAVAKAQDISNIVLAIGKLCELQSWQGGVSNQEMQQLLGEQQLQLLSGSAEPQPAANVLVALVRMSAGSAPVIGRAIAQEFGAQILGKFSNWLSQAKPQDICNALWACGELGLTDEKFTSTVAAKAQLWVPHSSVSDLNQALTACMQMQYKNEVFVLQLLQLALRLVQQQQASRQAKSPRTLTADDRTGIAAICGICIAQLNMQQLAGAAQQVVAASGVGSKLKVKGSSLRQLWVFHCWLLQHQLLDGTGLAGVLTQQQLQQGEQYAAQYGRDLRVEKLPMAGAKR